MTHFYAARDQGLAPTLALRSAMLAMLKRNDARAITDTTRAVGGLAPRSEVAGNVRHPYYWAAFQVYGD